MSKVLELKRTRKELVAKMAPLAERTDLTPEELKSFDDMKAHSEGLARQIERVEFVESEQDVLARVDVVPSKPRPDADPAQARKATPKGGRKPIENPGFSCVGELVACARFKPDDPRI